MINSANMFARQVVRRFTTSTFRRSGHHDPYDGVPGHNMPISTKNRHVLLAIFMLYIGSGFSIPFLMVRHQLSKLSGCMALVTFRTTNVEEPLDSVRKDYYNRNLIFVTEKPR